MTNLPASEHHAAVMDTGISRRCLLWAVGLSVPAWALILALAALLIGGRGV